MHLRMQRDVWLDFVWVEVLRPSQPNGVMSELQLGQFA